MIRLHAISPSMNIQPKAIAAKNTYAAQLATVAKGFMKALNSSSMRAI